MKTGFEPIAPYYDYLVQCTSGRLLSQQACSLFSELKTTTNVLVIGDGSGKITEQLLTEHSVAHLYYVEISPTLVSQAKRRLNKFVTATTQIDFIQQDIFETELPFQKIDIVLTPYFLDLWNDHQLDVLIRKIAMTLKENGLWYVADFNSDIYHNKGILNFLQRGLLRMLYLFFRWTVKLTTTRLPDIGLGFRNNGFIVMNQKCRGKGLLVTMVWKKISS